MNDLYDEQVSVAALTVACPECKVDPGNRCVATTPGPYRIKERPHYVRYELAVASAREEAVQKFAEPEPEPESKLLKLTLHTLGGVWDRSYRLDLVTDEERRFARLTVDQFAALLAGDQITVKAEL